MSHCLCCSGRNTLRLCRLLLCCLKDTLVDCWLDRSYIFEEDLLQHYFNFSHKSGQKTTTTTNFTQIFLIEDKTIQDKGILYNHLHTLKDKRILVEEKQEA